MKIYSKLNLPLLDLLLIVISIFNIFYSLIKIGQHDFYIFSTEGIAFITAILLSIAGIIFVIEGTKGEQ